MFQFLVNLLLIAAVVMALVVAIPVVHWCWTNPKKTIFFACSLMCGLVVSLEGGGALGTAIGLLAGMPVGGLLALAFYGAQTAFRWAARQDGPGVLTTEPTAVVAVTPGSRHGDRCRCDACVARLTESRRQGRTAPASSP